MTSMVRAVVGTHCGWPRAGEDGHEQSYAKRADRPFKTGCCRSGSDH